VLVVRDALQSHLQQSRRAPRRARQRRDATLKKGSCLSKCMLEPGGVGSTRCDIPVITQRGGEGGYKPPPKYSGGGQGPRPVGGGRRRGGLTACSAVARLSAGTVRPSVRRMASISLANTVPAGPTLGWGLARKGKVESGGLGRLRMSAGSVLDGVDVVLLADQVCVRWPVG